jgi:hypothetical protein
MVPGLTNLVTGSLLDVMSLGPGSSGLAQAALAAQ